ncbi:hypothetical protein O7621_07695 [Solwaraspora sp. WMMD937]|uniref:hypothetical protein n=1 Tax=Solwaraspora sp. WMMD937 TaxID=3016090 RepID=UPI00249A31D0|nr:hypothetical protein [Solwaraspora sp. WMMD937]WFE23182.1 hypothetical protein O7621_07695 [Solwaraspora sp. WMMD937]
MAVNDSADRPGSTDRGYPASVSRATLFWYAFASTLLVGWFLFGWLVLRQGFVDSVGEALGTGSALLLTVSVIEAARRHRHDGRPTG